MYGTPLERYKRNIVEEDGTIVGIEMGIIGYALPKAILPFEPDSSLVMEAERQLTAHLAEHAVVFREGQIYDYREFATEAQEG